MAGVSCCIVLVCLAVAIALCFFACAVCSVSVPTSSCNLPNRFAFSRIFFVTFANSCLLFSFAAFIFHSCFNPRVLSLSHAHRCCLIQGTDSNLPSSSEVQKAKQQRSKNAIPIIASLTADTDLDASSLCSTDLDGIALTSTQLPAVAKSFASSTASSADAQVQAILSAVLSSPQEQKTPDQETNHSDIGLKKPGKQLLSAAKEDLVEAERQLLEQLLGLLQQATPEMQEMSMLTDALKQLDELFLLVVVGEFNSGKSSVINALLGSRYDSCNLLG